MYDCNDVDDVNATLPRLLMTLFNMWLHRQVIRAKPEWTLKRQAFSSSRK